MKNLIILIVTTFFSVQVFAQKIAMVKITTTASVTESLEICKEAGKSAKYASKEYDLTLGKVVLWKYFLGGNSKELQVRVSTEVKEGKTEITLRMPHLPNTGGSYIKELKKYTKYLTLPDIQIGEYFDGIE